MRKKSPCVLSPTPEFTLAAGLLLLIFLWVRKAHVFLWVCGFGG